jgi:hypothetical protein
MKKIATNIIFKKKTKQLLAVGLQIEFDIYFCTPQQRRWNVPPREPKGHFFLFKDLVGVVVHELLGVEWQGLCC